MRYEVAARDEVVVVAAEIAAMFPELRWLELVLSELLLNAIEHGNLGIGGRLKCDLVRRGMFEAEVDRRASDPRYCDRRAWVQIARGDGLTFTVGDQGDGWDWHAEMEMSGSRPNGRGLGLVFALAPYGVELDPTGKVITVRAKP